MFMKDKIKGSIVATFIFGFFVSILLFAFHQMHGRREEECNYFRKHKSSKIAAIGGCDVGGLCGVILEDGSEHTSRFPIINGTIKDRRCE